MSELLIFWLINLFPVLVSPEVQKVVSEKFKLALQDFIIFLHFADLLFESLDVSFLNFLEVKLENLNSEFHFCVIGEADTREFPFIDPSLQLVNILCVEKSRSLELFLRATVLDPDIEIRSHLLALLVTGFRLNLLDKYFKSHLVSI